MTSDADQWRHHGSPAGPATLEEVAGLRWREPRRAAELAQQVLADAAAGGEAGTWLRAAGWLLCGRSAVGDAREIALELLADVDTRAGRDVLRRPEAGRLRVELAALAQSNGDPDVARDLLDGWQVAGPDAGAERDELELDRLAVLVRCALVDGADLSELRADVEELSRRLSGPPEALAELLLGSVHRDDGEPAAAAERALRGLARLGWTPAEPSSPPSSPHLGCALLSQWATALLEDGASADIPDGVKQLDVVDGGRHGVLWRLAVARAFAGRARPTADVLEDAASAAAAVDAPSLEAACRSAQAELFEGAGRFQDALAAVKAAMEAERTDRERAERLREALAGPAASLVDDLDLDPGADPGADLDVSRSEAALPDRSDALSGPVDGPAPTADVSDRAEPSPAPEGAALGGGAAGDTGSAGPAMATLDLGLDGLGETSSVPAETNGHPGPDGPASAASTTSRGHVLDGGLTVDPVDARRDRGGADAAEPIPGGPGGGAFGATGAAGGDERRNGSGPFRTDGPDARADGARAADVPTTAETGRADDTGAAGPGRVEPALPGPDVPWQLPGSRGADAASGDGEGSPLAEALLAELRGDVPDVPRPTPAESDPPPSTGEAESRGPVSGSDGGPPPTGRRSSSSWSGATGARSATATPATSAPTWPRAWSGSSPRTPTYADRTTGRTGSSRTVPWRCRYPVPRASRCSSGRGLSSAISRAASRAVTCRRALCSGPACTEGPGPPATSRNGR